jgi:hypothetical protein
MTHAPLLLRLLVAAPQRGLGGAEHRPPHTAAAEPQLQRRPRAREARGDEERRGAEAECGHGGGRGKINEGGGRDEG